MRSIYRLLDAVTNRVCEGFRVIEDICRFMLDDALSGKKLKDYRQNLRLTVSKVANLNTLLTQRDTNKDLGTTWEGVHEYNREEISDIVVANFKRIQEGLRSIEEQLKHVDTGTSSKLIEHMRYDSYVLEKEIIQKVSKLFLKNLNFTLVFDPNSCKTDPWQLLDKTLSAGVDSVQFRVKDYLEKEQENVDFIRKTHEICQKHNAPLIINDRADWALITQAEGLHLGQKDLAVADTQQILQINQIIGLSIASEEDLKSAENSTADYFGVGALFPSETKFYENTPGLNLYKKTLETLEKPVFGIGGISENILPLLKEIAHGTGKMLRICVSSAILKSDQPEKVAENMRRILDE